MKLSAEAEAFLTMLKESGAPAMNDLPPAAARQLVVPVPGPPEPVGNVRELAIPGPGGDLPIRIYQPTGGTGQPAGGTGDRPTARPVLLFYHGGGWVVGSLDSHDALARRLCNASGALIVSVDYRLGPEHPYPAAAEDSYAALVWAAAHAGEFGGDPRRIGVSGDSAGGNLAAVAGLLARDRGGPRLALQLLIYPITDAALDRDSYRAYGADYFLTTALMDWFWRNYLVGQDRGHEPYASPLRAESLVGLPPAIVLVAEFDPLKDEGLAYADRLEQAGVAVERVFCGGAIHGFLRRLDTFPSARGIVDALGGSAKYLFQRNAHDDMRSFRL